MAQHAVMHSATTQRPRHHADRIIERINTVLRDELKAMPAEFRGIALDHVQDHIARRHFKRLRRRLSA